MVNINRLKPPQSHVEPLIESMQTSKIASDLIMSNQRLSASVRNIVGAESCSHSCVSRTIRASPERYSNHAQTTWTTRTNPQHCHPRLRHFDGRQLDRSLCP